MKTTWTLELKTAAAQRQARALRRELQSLQSAFEDVDVASVRASSALRAVHAPGAVAGAQRRARAERQFAREVVRSTGTQRHGVALVSQDIRTQQRIRSAVDRAQRANARRASAEDRRRQARSDRAWQSDLRRINRIAHAEIRWDRQAQRASAHRARESRRDLRRSSADNMAMLSQVGGLFAGLASIAAGTVGIVSGIAAAFAGVAFQLGRSVLQMIAFREGSLMTLATLARTEGEARRPGETADQNSRRIRAQREQSAGADFGWAQDFARRTPLNMTQVVQLQTQAAAAGYRGGQAREMTAAAADAGALHPNDPTAASRFLLQMGQLRNSSVARAADYRPAAMAAGVNEPAARRRAAEMQGVSQRRGETDVAFQRRLDATRITGTNMHAAILAEQRAMLGGGASGTFAISKAGGIGAMLSNLDEGFQAFITSISGLATSPGMLALRAVLGQVADTLAGATSNGKRLQAFFATFVDRAAGAAASLFGPEGFDGALSRVLDIAREAWPVLQQLFSAFGGTFIGQIRAQLGPLAAQLGDQGFVGTLRTLIPFAEAFGSSLGRLIGFAIRMTIAAGEMLGVLVRLGELIGPVFDLMLAPFRVGAEGIHAMFTGIGTAMTQGIVAGIQAGAGAVYTEIRTMASGAVSTVTGALGIHSPSRVFANEVGQHIPSGIALGIDRGRGPLDEAMGSLVSPGDMGGAGLGGGRGVNIGTINLTLGAGANEETGRAAARGFVDELASLLEVPALAG